MKEIAIDKADFEGIVKSNLIYVDKTKYLYNIISGSKTYFFLSRPRRFGKSVTINTLKAIFEGKKELFKGLYIENSDWSWEKYPVIHLDFNLLNKQTSKDTQRLTKEYLLENARRNEISINSENAEDIFPELVKKLYEKYNRGVVFLVDEYDKPIVNFLGEEKAKVEIAKENRAFMKVFYDNLKPLEPYLKTVFITGVSKFSKVSIFSTLNNLIELDTNPDFAAMLGYTQEELDNYFKEYFDEFAESENSTVEEIKNKFKMMYNGFRFTKKDIKVYNPFSLGRAFANKDFGSYWFESGTPTFLINLIKNNNYDFTKIRESNITIEDIKAYDIENLKITALLYQTGYLTIKDYQQFGESTEIKLDFPNKEVEKGFYKQLLESYQGPDFSTSIITSIRKALLVKDFSKVIDYIKAIYAGIPYTIQPNNPIPQKDKTLKIITDYELNYHNIFFVIITLVSDWMLKINTEVLTSTGRIDCVIEVVDTVYIIEFKCNNSSDEAINQIKEKKYYEKYVGKFENINLVGINFMTEERNISDWKIELYN